MLIPIGHEKMSARRWPVITFSLIAINVVAFLATYSTMEEQGRELGKTRGHILILASMHPELQLGPEAQALVDRFKQTNIDLWNRLQQRNRETVDDFDAKERTIDDPQQLQADMDTLCSDYRQQSAVSVTEHYAFVPAAPQAIAYVTANFLHGGWLHLIGNMWFLWLAGFILEDVWGRAVYSIVYLVAGAAALQFHAWMYPASMTPTLGASGAVAALLGAFLVRFPRMKIRMAWLLQFRLIKFNMAAYWLLPLWLLTEVLSGTLFGQASGVAHWAHVGGFAFGALAALAFRYTGLEHKLDAAVEAKVTQVAADPAITQAGDQLAGGQFDAAISTLQTYLATHRDSIDGYVLLRQAYWAKGDLPGFFAAAASCCELHLKAREREFAWQDYEEFRNAGGDPAKLKAGLWLDLARAAEILRRYDAALVEFQRLAATHPEDQQGLQAILGAARCAMRLQRPQDALKYYQAAEASPVPHLDLESTIGIGLREAKAALAPNVQAVGVTT